MRNACQIWQCADNSMLETAITLAVVAFLLFAQKSDSQRFRTLYPDLQIRYRVHSS